ncbi:MAG TPA: hypothetical protein VGI43_15005 [Mucilaginibacter sp.]|jgi:hypothetical protein
MKSPIEIIEILNKILKENEPFRTELIDDFQNDFFNDESVRDEALEMIVGDIAYDLDFYEPNEEWRKQDSSFYGNEKLEEIIKQGIIKIENYNKAFE